MLTRIEEICGEYGAEFLAGVPAAPYTTFKIGGKCNLVAVNGVGVLRAVTDYCNGASVPFRVLGKGSNVLISDGGLDGIILLTSLKDGDCGGIDIDGETVDCAAGAKLSAACKAAAARSLTGMEFAYGIPGTVGGALYMNAGAYGGEMKDIVESCEYMDCGADSGGSEDSNASENSGLKQIGAGDMELSYRKSVFSGRLKNAVITKVRLKLKRGVESKIKTRMDEVFIARRDKQPLEFHSAGSTFKRPQGHFASKLIEDCVLKGRTLGGAQVSEKHAGFIVNKGGATFDDVVRLIDIVKDEVFDKTGVTLENEVIIWK